MSQGGVTYAEAMAMSEHDRAALEIAIGTARGGEYDFKARRWAERVPE